MKNRTVSFFLIALLAIFAFVGVARPDEIMAPQGDPPADQDQTKLQVLQSLNQIAISLTHIISYNDKVVLDQEYNTIINNLNLSRIPDAEIISLLQELMDLLANSKIQDHDRSYLARSYERDVENELERSATSRILDPAGFIANPYTGILMAVVNAGSFYFNYRFKIEDYRKAREEKAWEIDEKTLLGLNNFYKKLLKSSWELMRHYNLPDEWRLNENQLSDYTAILKESNLELRYRKLERIENSFQKFPPYWYYRGQAAQEIGNKQEALRCFNQFQQIHQGLFRKDPYAASTAMRKSMLLEGQATPDQLRHDLKIIVDNSDDEDWGNILFAALQYARIGDVDNAGRLIMRNLDNGHMAFIENPEMVHAVGPALLLNSRPDVFNRIMDTVMENDKIKNYDVLWLYGQIRNRDILNRIKPEFDRILLVTANKSLLNPLNLFKGDNLTLFLPTRWMADNLTIRLHLATENETREFLPSEMGPLPKFPEITVLTFNDVLSVKTYIKKKRTAQIAIDLVREKLAEDKTDQEAYSIAMIFNTTFVPSAEKSAKERDYAASLAASIAGGGKVKIFDPDASADQQASTQDQSAEKEEDAGDLVLWLAKEKLVVNGEAFGWSDQGIIFE
ncbi:MAG: hypothetical protein BM485_15675 [Desulfobulbaceae bacterium DB1]|nr:MAG: hypothetical protein BM485_15675 [Desulfobulbaceae bacterium DB1]